SGSHTIPRLILNKLGRLELDKTEKEMELLGRDLTLQNPSNGGNLAFVSLLPQFLLNRSLGFLSYLFNRIENSFDAIVSHRNYYPNEAELLALLKHPELMGRDPEKMRPLTQCLTSISHFIDYGAKLTDQTLKAWADIGFLTHGFRLWRYDTLGDTNSLLAQFGFQPAPTPRPFNEVFGKGFIYSDKETGLTLEFRRGYLLATHPEHGTLVIRNSSPVFGRDLLKHPAYYLKKSLTPHEILTFDPRTLNDLDSILHYRHYPSNLNDKDESSAHGISNLTQGIMDLNTRYRKFKIDTEAFQKGEFIGHLVPGLPKIIDVLNKLQSKKIPLPDLAFVQPEYLPYQPYFYRDADMRKVDRFPLTPQHLKELNDFVKGQWSPQKYLESDWIRFLQQAGVENRGELVMLAPEKSSSG
ncbi:MAG: hypothetical protein K2X66_13675, partial [Cyanobacteria bacterium]|nr:hypothetical protein [Cyanobacteriota bacterium]